MQLPSGFLESIESLLNRDGCPQEVSLFADALTKPSVRGLRANGLRIRDRETLRLLLQDHFNLPRALEPVPWTSDGLYYPADRSPASLAAYHAGLFYIQEPSAMLPAELLGATPGERILDLCAAPGGKSCRVAADLAGEGLLWANDLSADRIRPLIRNLELMGCANSVVSVETPDRLATVMPGWFHRVLVDAPCSGAGMLRRDSRALAGFGEAAPMDYVAEQAKILESADRLLNEGGTLVYSTCTFAFEENEGQIARFLENHPNYSLKTIPLKPGLSPGLPVEPLGRIGVRVWPHRADGDGHFCVVLVKNWPAIEHPPFATHESSGRATRLSGLLQHAPESYQRFLDETLTPTGKARVEQKLAPIFRLHEGHLHGIPMPDIPSGGLHLVKTGLYLGDIRDTTRSAESHSDTTVKPRRQPPPLRGSRLQNKNDSAIFTPSHALSHVLEPQDLRHVITVPMDSIEAARYIRGETLLATAQAAMAPPGAYVGVVADRYVLGLARQMPDGHLKNLYPPAWRKHS